MILGVLGNPDGWHVQQVVAAARRQSVAVRCLPFEELHAVTAGRGQRFGPLDDLDAVLVRTMPRGSLEQIIFRMDVLGDAFASGLPICNSPRSLETCIDKYLSLSRLQAAELPVPETIVAQSAEDAVDAFHRLGGDVVVKPLFGGEGRGIMRIDDEELAGRAFRTLEQLQAVLYVQQFIPHDGYDIRVLVVGERAVAIRRHGGGDWRTNLGRGGWAEPVELTESWEQLARRACHAVGVTVGGVDLLPDVEGQVVVLEVNAVPGWRGLQQTTGIPVGDWLIEHLRMIANSNRRTEQAHRTCPPSSL